MWKATNEVIAYQVATVAPHPATTRTGTGSEVIAAATKPMLADAITGGESLANVTFEGNTMTLDAEGADPTVCTR